MPAFAWQALVSAAPGETARAVDFVASVGGLDRENVHLIRGRLVLDERGWAELAAELMRIPERAEQIARESQRRLTRSDDEAVSRAALVMTLHQDVSELEESAGKDGAGDQGRDL